MPPGKRRSRTLTSEPLVPGQEKQGGPPGSPLLSSKKARLATKNPELEYLLDESSLLTQCLVKAGYLVRQEQHENILQQDQALFLKKFVKDISTNLDYPDNIGTMFETLSVWLDSDQLLKELLSPTTTSSSCSTARSSLQDSLLRLLLNTEQLQPLLLPRLLEKLAEVSLMEEGKEDLPVTQQSNIPRLILNAVRWLDKIVHPDGLAEKMTEILEATSRYQQVEVISALPEIIPDKQHPALVTCLRDMLDERLPLVSSILDCFTNLNLTPDLVSDLRSSVLKKLPDCAMPDLPSMVEFVLSSVTRENVNSVVQDLRDSLDLSERVLRPSQRPGPKGNRVRAEDKAKTVERIVLDKVAIMASRDRWAADAWLSAVQSAVEPDSQKPLDLMVLLLLHKLGPVRRAVESLVRNKVRAGLFSLEMVSDAFRLHISTLGLHFSALLELSEVLLQSQEVVVTAFAREIYSQAFSYLGSHCQQEIVTDLVSKVGTGGGGEVTKGALSVLSKLAEERSEQLAKYGVFISAVLDFMEGLSLFQVKTIMTVLATLAWGVGGKDREGVLQDDLVIIIKKQINSTSKTLRRMGVIGAVSAVRAMLLSLSSIEQEMQPQAESSRLSSDTSRVGGPGLTEATELMGFVKSRTSHSADTGGLFLDELSSMIHSAKSVVSRNVLLKFTASVSDDFQNEFIDADELGKYKIETCTGHVLDDTPEQDSEDTEPIALPLAMFVLRSCSVPLLSGVLKREDRQLDTAAARLLPFFRLLSVSVDSKEEIDALLGCGLTIFTDTVLRDLDKLSLQEKNAVCSTLFYTANWLLELVNCFAAVTLTDETGDSSETETYKNKVLVRLKEHLQVRQQISKVLVLHPTFCPPNVLFSEDTASWSPPDYKEKAKKGEKGKGKGKGKRKAEPADRTMNATLHLISQPPSAPQQTLASQQTLHTDMSGGTTLDLRQYRPFFRELDLDCLAVLGYQVATTESEPDWSEEQTRPRFRPPELVFLLQDLLAKLDHCLVPGKRKVGPGKINPLAGAGFANISCLPARKLVQSVSEHLGHICSHLDEVLAYFKRLFRLNDGILDCADMISPQSILLSDCLRLGFKVLHAFFSWSGFTSPSNSDLLLASLTQVAGRVVVDLTPASSRVKLVSVTSDYLARFSDYIYSADVASAHLGLVSTVTGLSDTSSQPTVSSLAKTYLSRDWKSVQGEKEKGAEFNQHVERMTSLFLSHSNDMFSSLDLVCREGVEVVVKDKGGSSETFPVVTRGTLGVLYKVMLSQLVTEVRKTTFGVTKDPTAQLAMWSKAVASLSLLTGSLKFWQNRLMLGAVLRYSRPFLDHFIRQGMPLVEKLFRRRRNECVELIKDLQQSTRYLQSVCAHSKIVQDVSLSNNVPQLKRSLEVLVYRAKAMLAANDCLEAFVFGNLKNKDLSGAVILSQADNETEEEEGEDNSDEGDSDVEIGINGEEEGDPPAEDEHTVLSDVY